MALESLEHFDAPSHRHAWKEKKQHEFLQAEHRERYFFARQFVAGKRVLDVACGEGYGADILKQAGAAQVLAGDQDEVAIEAARRKYKGVTYEVLNAEALHLPEQSIDVAISFETIEHLEYPELFLAGLKQCVVPGGDIFISTPNRRVSNPGTTLQDRPRNPFHVREYTPDEFRMLLAKYFSVVATYEQGIYFLTRSTLIRRMQRLFKAFLIVFPWGRMFLARVRPMAAYREPTYVLVHCRRDT